jgi:hypothetical protein
LAAPAVSTARFTLLLDTERQQHVARRTVFAKEVAGTDESGPPSITGLKLLEHIELPHELAITGGEGAQMPS